jgi:hypothetical protein
VATEGGAGVNPPGTFPIRDKMRTIKERQRAEGRDAERTIEER